MSVHLTRAKWVEGLHARDGDVVQSCSDGMGLIWPAVGLKQSQLPIQGSSQQLKKTKEKNDISIVFYSCGWSPSSNMSHITPSFYDSLFREWGCTTSHLALQEHRRHWVLDSYTFPLRFSIFHTCHLSKISDPAGPKLCYVTLFYQTVFANNSLGKSAVHRLAGAPHINNPTAVHTLQAMRMP